MTNNAPSGNPSALMDPTRVRRKRSRRCSCSCGASACAWWLNPDKLLYCVSHQLRVQTTQTGSEWCLLAWRFINSSRRLQQLCNMNCARCLRIRPFPVLDATDVTLQIPFFPYYWHLRREKRHIKVTFHPSLTHLYVNGESGDVFQST